MESRYPYELLLIAPNASCLTCFRFNTQGKPGGIELLEVAEDVGSKSILQQLVSSYTFQRNFALPIHLFFGDELPNTYFLSGGSGEVGLG